MAPGSWPISIPADEPQVAPCPSAWETFLERLVGYSRR